MEDWLVHQANLRGFRGAALAGALILAYDLDRLTEDADLILDEAIVPADFTAIYPTNRAKVERLLATAAR